MSIAFLIALWAIYFASTSPHLLWPLALFTLIFRFISPLIFVRVLNKWQLSDNALIKPSTKVLVEAFPGFGMVLGTFIILSPYFDSNSSETLELFIATVFAIFTFSQFYLFLFIDYIRKDSLAFAWIAGFLIGLSHGAATIWFPEATNVVIYVMMGLTIIFRPQGLFGVR